MSTSLTHKLRPLARAARLTELRLRAGEAIRSFSFGAIPTLTSLGAFVAHEKLTHGAHDGWHKALLALTVCSGAATLGAVIFAFVRRYPAHYGAIKLDAAHGFHDRVTSALSFAELPDDKRTPLMDAAIDDALEHGTSLSAKRAAPIRLPGDLAFAATLGLLVFGLGSLQWSRKTVLAQKLDTIEAVSLSPDDIDLYRETLRELAERDQSPETQRALEKFNQLVEDLAQKRLDRAEAFKRMEALEQELSNAQKADAKALDEALKGTSEELKKSELTKPIADALAKKDLKTAEKAMKELAEKLRDKQKKLSEADKKRLKEALEAASRKHKEALSKLQQRRDELRASLLQREQKAGAQSDEERRLLQRDKRELERLDRDIEQKERAQRQLDRLDRELAQAAEDLMRELGLSADDLDRGAEDINRMAQEELSEQEKEELRQRLEELRELLRQEGKGGEELKKRMRKFAKKARGKQGQQGQQGQGQGQDQNGQKQQGQGDEDGEDEDEGDEDGQGQGQGQGQGDGQGQGQGKRLTLRKSGSGQGQGQGDGQGQGEGQGQGQGKSVGLTMGQGQGQGDGQGGDQPGGQGQGQGGKSWGSGHDGQIAGQGTSSKFGTQDVQAAATDSGQGPSVSETIQGAAEKGFVGKKYKHVYTDYRTKAEEALKNEEIPAGYRFYVQRYFQLIRPRE